MCNSEYVISVQSQPPFAVESIIVYLLVILLSFPVAYFPSQENIPEEHEKRETTPTTVETRIQVPQKEDEEEDCECLGSSKSEDSFRSAEGNELWDENLSSNKLVEEKITVLEDCLKALMKPWNVEGDSIEDQQSATDSDVQTTFYQQLDDTDSESFGNEDTAESISPELSEILSVVLRNTWLSSDSVHEDATTSTKAPHRQTPSTIREESTENGISQIKPGYSAILDSILNQSVNDYSLTLGNYEPPFAVEYISKEEARRRRWLPPKKEQKDNSVPIPSLYGCEWADIEDSHSNVPTTNVYYCTEIQLTGEGEEPLPKMYTEKPSPRSKLSQYDNVVKLLDKNKMKEFEQENESSCGIYDDARRYAFSCGDIEDSEKTHDRVLSEYQKQLICGHLTFFNSVEDRTTFYRQLADEMRGGNGPRCVKHKVSRLPKEISKCGPQKNLRCISRGYRKKYQKHEYELHGYGKDDRESTLDKGLINYPTRIMKEKKDNTEFSFGDGHRSDFCNYSPSGNSCLESDCLQLEPCRDYSATFRNIALKSDVTEEMNGQGDDNISSLPSAYSNINRTLEDINTTGVCSQSQDRFIGAQSFRMNNISSISRKRRRKSASPEPGDDIEDSTN